MSETLLEVNGLRVNLGSFSLQNIGFTMARKDYVMVLGPTGCGKTVLLETIAGLRLPDGGSIFINGREVTHWPPELRKLGFAYQDSLLYPFLTVKDNILFGARARGIAGDPGVRRRLEQLLEIMKITHLLGRYPRFLSGGEKQRVSLARAILTRPQLLLLDEPLSALDPRTRYAMQELLRGIHLQEEMGVIHVTHDFSEAIQLGSRVILLRDGRIEQVGEPLEVFLRPGSEYAAEFLHGENMVSGRILRRDGRLWFKASGSGFRLGPLPPGTLPGEGEGECTLLVRSGNIHLERDGEAAEAASSWGAVIRRVVFNRTHVDVYCQGNGLWQAALSLGRWQELRLNRGERVMLWVRTENIHLITPEKNKSTERGREVCSVSRTKV